MKRVLLILFIVISVISNILLGYYFYNTYNKKDIANTTQDTNITANTNDSFENQVKNQIKNVYPTYIDESVLSFNDEVKRDYPKMEIGTISNINSPFIWKTGGIYVSVPFSEVDTNISFRHPDEVKVLALQGEDQSMTTTYYAEITNNLKTKFFNLIPSFDSMMIANGYTRSEENIIRSPWSDSLEVGYEKENTQCLLSSFAGKIQFRCIDSLKGYSEQQTAVIYDLHFLLIQL